MSSNYPGAIDSFETNTDWTGDPNAAPATARITASDMNNVQDGLHNTQATLGVNPQGSYATVKDRLDALAAGGGAGALTERGNWTTVTGYSVSDVVTQSGIRYVCRTAHTSGTFSTDLAANRWVALDSGSSTLGGDLSGTTGAATVTQIQGRPVASTAPTSSQALVWNGSAWAPATVAGGGGAVSSVVGQTGAVTGAQILADTAVAAALTAKADASATTTALAGKAQALTRTTVKTGPYTAAAGDLVPVDTTSGAVTVTLPTAPADRTRVAVKHAVQGGTNAVTLACGGSDVFNVTAGPATRSLVLSGESVVVEYAATGAIWTVVASDTPVSQLDARYLTPSAASATYGRKLIATAKTGAYTAVAGDLVLADATSAGFTVTLPASPTVGDVVAVKKVDTGSNIVTVQAAGKTIDGDATATIVSEDSGAVFTYDGTNWQVTAVMQTAVSGGGGAVSSVVGQTGAVTGSQIVADSTVAAALSARLAAASNLSDVASASTARTNLGLGTAATISATAGGDLSGTLPSPTVAKVNGVSVTGTPTSGQVITATSGTAATWQTPAGGSSTPGFGVRGGATGGYYSSPFNAGGTNNYSRSVGRADASPFVVTSTMTVAALGCTITTLAASATVRLGIYTSGTNGRPDQLVVDAGTVSAAATGSPEVAVTQSLTPGVYWLVAAVQGTGSPTLTCWGVYDNVFVGNSSAAIATDRAGVFTGGSVTGALPSTFPTVAGVDAVIRVFVKAA